MEEVADLDQQVVSMVMEVEGIRVAEDPQRHTASRSSEGPLPADGRMPMVSDASREWAAKVASGGTVSRRVSGAEMS